MSDLYDKLATIAEQVELRHRFNPLFGKCSCGGFKSRNTEEIKGHYIAAAEDVITAQEWTIP